MVRFLIHRPKWIVVAFGILIFCLAQTEWLTDSRLWQKIEGMLIDRRYLLRGENPPDPNIKLIGLGTTSFQLDSLAPEEIAASPTLQKMQQPWPWDRSVYAAILEKLMAAGAKVVMFDFVFPSETEGDEVFAKTLEKYKDRVVIGEMIADEEGPTGKTKKLTTPNQRLLLPGTESVVGLVNIWTDNDDIVRRARYHTSVEREILETATTGKTAMDPRIIAYLKKQISEGKIPDDLTHITTRVAEKFKGKIFTPPPAKKSFINFQNPPGTYRAWPVENMFVNALWQKPPFRGGLAVSNKIVIVGPMAEIFHDIHATPFGETPGPEIQAQMLAALLQGDRLSETSDTANFWVAFGTVILALLICLGIPQALLKGLLLVGSTVALLVGSQIAFTDHNLVMPVMSPLFCLVATGSFGIIFEYALEQLERRRYRNVLDRYVSKNVARTILEDRRSFVEALKGRKQPVTVLFSDIRGFTTMTESSDADKLVAQLNEYFSDMVGSVLQHNGTLQKFIGDAIMAVWGDTCSAGIEADARGAVTTALQMRAALAKLNADWKDNSDRNKLSIGIGVNHGEVIVGNIGHPQRMEFTVLGDGVNLAARLESATKQFHADILIGEQTEKLTREKFIFRTVDLLTVKGKTKPVEVFGLLSDRSQPPPAWLAVYHEAVKLYRARKFSEAVAKFEA
ncbi:MAG TPA: adenylate/guanylate cyclase domain-containing protein, partial [Verrucomicrobiae bacterium]